MNEKRCRRRGWNTQLNAFPRRGTYLKQGIIRVQRIVPITRSSTRCARCWPFDEIDMKHHSGIISEFRRWYIKTGIFETRMSEIISVLFDVRTDSDYDDFFVISKADTAVQIENAEYFVSSVRAYLKNKEW